MQACGQSSALLWVEKACQGTRKVAGWEEARRRGDLGGLGGLGRLKVQWPRRPAGGSLMVQDLAPSSTHCS